MDSSTWRLDYPIRSDRLLLRPHEMEDLDDLVEFHGDPRVTRYIPWPTRSRDETRAALQGKLSQGEAREVGRWIVLAVHEVESGRVIGEVLLKRAGTAEAEVGYVIRHGSQGLGLASEAVDALLSAAAEQLPVRRVDAVVDPANAASIRLLGRLGFSPVQSADSAVLRYSRALHDGADG